MIVDCAYYLDGKRSEEGIVPLQEAAARCEQGGGAATDGVVMLMATVYNAGFSALAGALPGACGLILRGD